MSRKTHRHDRIRSIMENTGKRARGAANIATREQATRRPTVEPNLVLVPDYEAHGCFPGLCCQVIELMEMGSRRDVTYLVDQGTYWHSCKEIEAHILRTTGQVVHVEMVDGEPPLVADTEQVDEGEPTLQTDEGEPTMNMEKSPRVLEEPQFPVDLDVDGETPEVANICAWFFCRYEDPANGVPYESAEGGYQYMSGRPHDARDVLGNEFSDADPVHLERAIELIESHGTDWVEIGVY